MKANRKQWHNSSDEARFRGWMWKGDTSSDETTGHVFALSVVANLSPLEWERTLATKLLLDFVRGAVLVQCSCRLRQRQTCFECYGCIFLIAFVCIA